VVSICPVFERWMDVELFGGWRKAPFLLVASPEVLSCYEFCICRRLLVSLSFHRPVKHSITCRKMSGRTVMVAVKRVLDYTARVRVKSDKVCKSIP
jgi:hypothetical protein